MGEDTGEERAGCDVAAYGEGSRVESLKAGTAFKKMGNFPYPGEGRDDVGSAREISPFHPARKYSQKIRSRH